MPRVDNVKEVRVRISIPEAVVLGGLPGCDPLRAKVKGWITLYMWKEHARVLRAPGHILAVLDGRDEREDVLLELQADELLAPDVAQCRGLPRVGVVPRLVDFLGEVVDPAAVRGGEGKG